MDSKIRKDRRTRLFEIVDVAQPGDWASYIYDCTMVLIVIISLIPLAFKSAPPVFTVIDHTAGAIFFIDYLLRFAVADKKMHGKAYDFLLYPFMPMSIIDLISILPSFTPLTGSFKLIRIVRTLRAVRVIRIFKMFRYSKNLQHLGNVFRRERVALGSVCFFVIAYIIICALVVMNLEPQTFDSFFDAVYWAAVSLTTIGYGDIYPITDIGRAVTIVSSLVGIIVIALPTAIITAGIMLELDESRAEREAASHGLDRLMGIYSEGKRNRDLYKDLLKKEEELNAREADLLKREEKLKKREG